MARRRNKALRILGGTTLMLAFVAVVLGLLAQRAGDWGVPYFSFEAAHGSPCTNDLAGYTCTPLTVRDLETWAGVDLPEGTEVLSGTYRSTHDYEMTAQLRMPADAAKSGLAALEEAYGPCRRGTGSPLATAGLTSVCVLQSSEASEPDGAPGSRIWSVGTGLDDDDRRLVGLSVRSR